MSAISSWISQIVLLILLAIVLELLLPNDSFQKYVKLVIGLVLIVALLSPIMKVLHMPIDHILSEFSKPDDDDPLKNSINQYKSEIEDDQAAYKSNMVAVQMKNYVQEELMDQYDLAIVGDIDLELNSHYDASDSSDDTNPIKHAVVVLGHADQSEKDQTQAKSKDEDTIQPVKKVEIQVASVSKTKTEPTSKEKATLKEVKQFLAKKWEIPPDSLTLQLEGGGS
ncbi:stage III sporulation protein AF [Pullulanibacillus pueri]|uniref:Stage III sporulation protein AF n=1 Tax=Pullulanibacillus pueri TaxID=1437324 RepID=A0A8J2ZVE2_9BACL|nr:stage III sporulation protein AF [Pullulanibacillus pueri]MBM7681589.1 stage III sporulation protein AF [Pullulanibacillus pueri]GGH79554.1 hypothetical protein GCM10007096_14650 [Pullulanibacillus pueri]